MKAKTKAVLVSTSVGILLASIISLFICFPLVGVVVAYLAVILIVGGTIVYLIILMYRGLLEEFERRNK